jgi:voltage-gated sodium channel
LVTIYLQVLEACDLVILGIFTLDVVVKVVAEGNRPLHFFADSWNVFDFFIVFACFVFMLPFMPDVGSMLVRRVKKEGGK